MKHPISSLLKVDKKAVKEDEGIVYLLEITIEGEKYVKVGVTSRTMEERAAEIAISCFRSYRYFPHIYPKRYRKTTGIYQKEAEILQALKEYRAEPDKLVSGHTEMHKIELDHAVVVYERVLNNVLPVVNEATVCEACGKKQVFPVVKAADGEEPLENEEDIRYTCGNNCNLKEKKSESKI